MRLGRTSPRVGTPRGTFQTHGQVLEALAPLFDIPELYAWQRLAADRALEYVDTEAGQRWVHNSVTILVARQAGKTTVAATRILAGLYLFDDYHILHLAQDRALPREVFKKVAAAIDRTPSLSRRLAKRRGIQWGNGQESVNLRDGSSYRILAPTEEAVRGYDRVGLVFFDEVRTQADYATWSAVGYTQRAHPNPQRWAVSNAGHADSVVLNGLMARGQKAALDPDSDPTVCYLEWSATPEMDRTDPDTWRWANPSLGIGITESALLEELRTDTVDGFDTEALCIPQVSLSAQAVPWDRWVSAADLELPAMDPGELTWLAYDIDPEREYAAIVVGAWDGDRLIVGLDKIWTQGAPEAEVADRLEALWNTWAPSRIGYDPHTGKGVVDRLPGLPFESITGANWIVACGQLLDLAKQGAIGHGDQADLNTQVAAAGRRDVGDGTWRMSRKDSSQPIPAAIALARLAHIAIAGAGKGVGIRVL